MLYKFKSKAAGDVIMTEPVGDAILKLAGKSPGPKGIVTPAELPAAIAALESAVAADEAARAQAEAEGHTPLSREGVGLRQRAWPLLEMMKRAQSANQEIVWGV